MSEMTTTFKSGRSWWELISTEEWQAMSPHERWLTKMAIPHPPVLVREGDDGVVTVDVDGFTLKKGESVTITTTLVQS